MANYLRVFGPSSVTTSFKFYDTTIVARAPVLLSIEARNESDTKIAIPNGETFQLYLDGAPLGPVLSAPYQWTWDPVGIQGAHALKAVRVAGTTAYVSMSSIALGAVLTGAQNIPATHPFCSAGTSLSSFNHRAEVGTAAWSGDMPVPASVAMPQRVPAPGTFNPATPFSFYVDPLIHTRHSYSQKVPKFNVRADGQVVASGLYQQAGQLAGGAIDAVKNDLQMDGPRNVGTVSPYSTFIPDPNGSGGYIGIDLAGRIFRLGLDGAVTTLVGTHKDKWGTPVATIGNFVNGPFKGPCDITHDWVHPGIYYVADTFNYRIAMVDMNVSPPAITTLIGQPGVEGFQNGPGLQAKLSLPYSIVVHGPHTGNTVHVYWVEDGETLGDGSVIGHAVRYSSLFTPGQIPEANTLAGGPGKVGQGTVGDSVPFASALIYRPQACRWDSQYNLIFAELQSASIRKVDWASGTIKTIAKYPLSSGSDTWLWIDVDREGTIGPIDRTYYVEAGSVNRIVRIDPDGTISKLAGSGKLSHGPLINVSTDAVGHYPWAVAINKHSMITSGFGSVGLSLWRPKVAADPVLNYNDTRFVAGRGLFIYEFGMLYGRNGYNRLGFPVFDTLGAMSDNSLYDYLKALKPAWTDAQVDDVAYYIRMMSIESMIRTIPLALDTSADTTAPVVTITSPSAGATVSGNVTVTATATDNVGVVSATLYLDGVAQSSDTDGGTYSFIFDSTLIPNGSHTLRVDAEDLAGNIGQSPLVSVTVSNIDVVVDNLPAGQSDANHTYSGAWYESSATGEFGGSSLFGTGSSTFYRFIPTLPESGLYDVYVWYTTHPNRSTNVPVYAIHANGTTAVNYNMQTGGGQWVYHGQYTFTVGAGHRVSVSGENGQASADAVRFVKV